MKRPPPPDNAPGHGYAWAPREAGPEWRLVDARDHGRRCRGWKCVALAALVLEREARRYVGRSLAAPLQFRVRWGYCADHAFGKWAEGGRVFCWSQVEQAAEG